MGACFYEPVSVPYDPPQEETPSNGDRRQDDDSAQRERERQAREEQYRKEKKEEWQKILVVGNQGYKDISNLIGKKCNDCHHENRRLPLYGRVLRRINPVFKHQKEGLLALDFSLGFPLKTSQGYRPKAKDEITKFDTNASTQLSYLRAIKEEVIHRSMPLKSYTAIYRSRKISKSDEEKILNWVDPLILQLENYIQKYNPYDPNASASENIIKVFESKCIRCHGKGNSRGGFGDIEDLGKLKDSPYISLDHPEQSELYQQVLNGDMPIARSEQLTQEELNIVLEWIKEERDRIGEIER